MKHGVEKTNTGKLRTKNYSIFSFIEGNRPISDKHVSDLIKSFQKHGYLEPIVTVNEKYQIVNGQHTFVAAKTTGEWIYFTILKGARLPAVHGLNSNALNWNTQTFMISYAGQGRPEYVKYKEFKELYGFNHKECVLLLTGGQARIKNIFWGGKFKITNYDHAVKYANMIEKVKEFYEGYRRNGFVSAIVACFENSEYDHDRFLHKLTLKLTANVAPLSDVSSKKKYIEIIEGIYNLKRRGFEKAVYLREL